MEESLKNTLKYIFIEITLKLLDACHIIQGCNDRLNGHTEFRGKNQLRSYKSDEAWCKLGNIPSRIYEMSQ